MMSEQVDLRLLEAGDSIGDLTELLHRAYLPLAKAGMRYWASYQDEAGTRLRCAQGECWIAARGQRLIGTITWRAGGASEKCPWYTRRQVAIFGQFAVEPELQRTGIGTRLLERVESRVQEAGFKEVACDTAEQADGLISYYVRRGYRGVETVQWEQANYRSVILSKNVVGASGEK
jgi:GNAT superfamily N-acetyltransferase